MMVQHFYFLVLGFALASACVPEAPKWDCSELPHITAEFSGKTIQTCGERYAKGLFEAFQDASFSGVDENKYYTLIMVDPDAPGSPAGQGWLHLIKSSISGSELVGNGNVIGTDVTAYARPTPPRNTGPHRYFLYLYEESDARPVMEGIAKRAKFDIHSFASGYNLCGPVAMNMFVTEFE